jgi:hypothetical protein
MAWAYAHLNDAPKLRAPTFGEFSETFFKPDHLWSRTKTKKGRRFENWKWHPLLTSSHTTERPLRSFHPRDVGYLDGLFHG